MNLITRLENYTFHDLFVDIYFELFSNDSGTFDIIAPKDYPKLFSNL